MNQEEIQQEDRAERITVLEALAVVSEATGIDKSNQTTQPAADASDQ